MSDCLSRILLPLDRNDFLRHYQTREYFHVDRNSGGYYDDVLSPTDLDAFFQSEQLPSAFINVVRDGTRCPLEEWSRVDASARGEQSVAIPEKLFHLYAEGATLVLNQADRSLPSLNGVCRAMTLDLGFRVVANVYITPRSAAGFSKHVDDHEVLVLQIAGSKRWQLLVKEGPVVEIDLQPGDLLYLPRDLAHTAAAQEFDSIHVTLGLLPVYAFQLIEEIAALAHEDGGFEQPMPPRFADDDAKRTFEAAFLRQLQELILRAKPSALLERRFRSLAESQRRGWPGRLSDLRHFRDMTPETVVCRRPGVLTVVTSEGKFLKVDFAGKSVSVPGFLEGAMGKIMGGDAFAIGEIEGFIDSPGKVKLVAEFVRAGLLRIVSL
jgi:bifunctional lysine-specific demethylase and histidyl-hydroxylase NO66